MKGRAPGPYSVSLPFSHPATTWPVATAFAAACCVAVWTARTTASKDRSATCFFMLNILDGFRPRSICQFSSRSFAKSRRTGIGSPRTRRCRTRSPDVSALINEIVLAGKAMTTPCGTSLDRDPMLNTRDDSQYLLCAWLSESEFKRCKSAQGGMRFSQPRST